MTKSRMRAASVAAAMCGALMVPPASPTVAAGRAEMSLREAIGALPVSAENRTGYQRTAFKHWIDADRDGCNTREEVLLAEAVKAPQIGPGCALTAGRWHSYYDNIHVDGPRSLDIDHMVPLAEAWDSGASTWTAQQREAYANDLNEPHALVAVTARTNRSKTDQDPAQWLPPHARAQCLYLADWVMVKTVWRLAIDPAERTALIDLAEQCPNTPVPAAVN